MSGISKTVANRIRNAQVVTASFDVHGPDTIDDLANVFSKAGVGNFDAAAARNLLGTLSSLLKNSTETLERAETAYATEMSNDGDKRDLRDEAVTALRENTQYARTLLSAAVNAATLRNWGLDKPVPTTPDTLLVYANYAVERLRADHRILTRHGITVDTQVLADAIDGPRAELQAALDDLKLDSRENQLALEKRNDALEQWNLAYSVSASVLSDLYRLAGRQNLAKRVRPTVRRISGEVNVDEEISEDGTPVDTEETPLSLDAADAEI